MSAPTTHNASDTHAARLLAPETHQRAGRATRTPKEREDAVLVKAARIMEARAMYNRQREAIDSATAARQLLQMRLGHLEHEEFHCLWLDAQHHVLAVESLFRGTLTQTSVYPREVVKSALHHNAAAVILSHNHPSGVGQPSRADELLTTNLTAALGLIDVRVLDHVIVTVDGTYSFAEHGKL